MGFLNTLGKVASALNPVSGIISAGVGAIGNAISTNNTNKNNAAINAANNAFNASEAEKARQFNSQQTALQNEFNASEAEKNRAFQKSLYERSLSWNSPSNQLKMMADAGLNPNNFSNGVTSAPSVPSGSAASGSALSGPAASASGPIAMQNPFNFEAVTQSIKNLAEAKKTESETKQVDALTATENLLRDGKVQLQNSEISLNIVDAHMRKSEMDKIGKELIALDVSIDAAKQSIRNSIASEAYTKAMADYQVLKSEEQRKINEKLAERLRLELKESQSRIAKNYSDISINDKTIDKIVSEVRLNGFKLNNMPIEINLNNRMLKAQIQNLEGENTIVSSDVEAAETVSGHTAYKILKAYNVYVKEFLAPLSEFFKTATLGFRLGK
nr:unnamed protein product [uncultured bacterium]